MEESLCNNLLNCLSDFKDRNPESYVNPNFLCEVLALIETYGDLESTELDKWAQDMWGH